MTVDIQCKSGSSMSQISLDSFNVIAVLKRQDRKGMSKIMDTGAGKPDLLNDLLKMITDRSLGNVLSFRGW